MRQYEQAASQPLNVSHPQHFLSKPCRKIAFLEHPSKMCSPNMNEFTTDTEKQKEMTRPLQVFLRSRTRGIENVISQNSPTTEIQIPLENQHKSNFLKSSRKISVFLDSPQQESPSALQQLHTTTATPQNSKISHPSLIFHLKSKKAITARTTAATTQEDISTNSTNNKPAEDNYFQTNDSANHQKVTSLFNIINSIASFPHKQQQQQQPFGLGSTKQGINSIHSKSSNSLLPESPLLENQKKDQYQRGWRAAIDPAQTQQHSKIHTSDYLDQSNPLSLKSKKKTNQLISIFPTNNPMKPKLFQDSSRSFETSNYSTGLFVKTQFSQKSNHDHISGILPHGSPILKNQMTNSPMRQQTSISLRLIPSSKLIMPLNTSATQNQIIKIENNNSDKQHNNYFSCERINPPTTTTATSTSFNDLLRKQNRTTIQAHSSRNKWYTAKTVDISRGTSIEKTKFFLDEAGQSCSQSSRNNNSNRLCSSHRLIHQATQSIEPSLFNEETNKQIELFLQRMREMHLEYENPKRVSQVIYKMINNIPYLVKMLFVEEDGKQMPVLKEKINLTTIQQFISQRENLRSCLEQNPLNPMMLVVQRPEGKMEAAEQRLCGDLSFLEQKISLLTQKHFKEKCDQLANALIDESQHIQSLERSIELQISSVQNKSRLCQVQNTSGLLLSKHNYRGVDGYRFLKKKSFPEGTNRTHSYFKGEFGRLGEFQSIDKQTIGVTHEIDNMLERIKDLGPSPAQSKITSAYAKKKPKNEKNMSNSNVNKDDLENNDNES